MRMIDLLIKLDQRTQAEIGAAANLNPREFNDKLHNRGNRLTEDDVRAVAAALKVQPDLLMDDVPEGKVLASLGIGKSPQVSESAPAHVVEVDPQLEELDDITKLPGRVPVTVYASIAAGGLDDHATVKEETPAWVPKGYANCYGLRVSGTSMVDAGIDPEDILIVRLTTRAREERIVVALIENGATVKRYRLIDGEAVLVAEGTGHGNIPASDGFKVQGVVLGIHKRRR